MDDDPILIEARERVAVTIEGDGSDPFASQAAGRVRNGQEDDGQAVRAAIAAIRIEERK